MRTMAQAMLALGFVGVMAVSIPVTATAQQINFSGLGFSGPGVDVEFRIRPDPYQNYRQYRDFDNRYYYSFARRPGTQRYYSDGFSYQTNSITSGTGLNNRSTPLAERHVPPETTGQGRR